MNALQRRIKNLEDEIKKRSGGMFTVHYKDGTSRRISPGDTIQLCLYEANKIERFEEEPGGNNGFLEELVNSILISGE